MNKRRAKRRFIIGCLTPAIILVTIFMIIPTINVFYMSLFKWGGLSNNKKLVWFVNFKILFEDGNQYGGLRGAASCRDEETGS